MDIERLKELQSEVSNMAFIALSKLTDKNARANIVKTGEDLQELIDEAIANQVIRESRTSEEVQKAIKTVEGIAICSSFKDQREDARLAITALQQMRTPVEPMLDHWAVCPECGYEYILEIMVDYATSDEWLVKYCPECGQPFKYDDQWKDDDGKTNLKWKKALHGEQWIPVGERLPESGKHILLCCEVRPSGKRYVCDGYYAASKSTTSGYSSELDCEYDEETDEYYLPEGYYEVIKNWDDYSSIVIDDFVTHWKPLPEPPKGE